MNVARYQPRAQSPMVLSQLNIRPVFDINADVQGRDLGSVVTMPSTKLVETADMPDVNTAMHACWNVAGQIVTMRESFNGLFAGIALAVVLVFLLDGHEFPELARSSDRSHGGSLCGAGRA